MRGDEIEDRKFLPLPLPGYNGRRRRRGMKRKGGKKGREERNLLLHSCTSTRRRKCEMGRGRGGIFSSSPLPHTRVQERRKRGNMRVGKERRGKSPLPYQRERFGRKRVILERERNTMPHSPFSFFNILFLYLLIFFIKIIS